MAFPQAPLLKCPLKFPEYNSDKMYKPQSNIKQNMCLFQKNNPSGSSQSWKMEDSHKFKKKATTTRGKGQSQKAVTKERER